MNNPKYVVGSNHMDCLRISVKLDLCLLCRYLLRRGVRLTKLEVKIQGLITSGGWGILCDKGYLNERATSVIWVRTIQQALQSARPTD